MVCFGNFNQFFQHFNAAWSFLFNHFIDQFLTNQSNFDFLISKICSIRYAVYHMQHIICSISYVPRVTFLFWWAKHRRALKVVDYQLKEIIVNSELRVCWNIIRISIFIAFNNWYYFFVMTANLLNVSRPYTCFKLLIKICGAYYINYTWTMVDTLPPKPEQVRLRNHIENLLIEIPSESIIIPSINCSNPATDSLRWFLYRTEQPVLL